MRNHDYQNTQKNFNLGCDSRILTSTFKDIEVHSLSMPISVRVEGFYIVKVLKYKATQ